MLLLAHLMTQADGWRHARLVLKSVVKDAAEGDALRARFESMLPDLRMDVHLEVLEKPPEQGVAEIIKQASMAADLVFLGLGSPEPSEEAAYAGRLLDLVDGLPTTILLKNASRFQGRLV